MNLKKILAVSVLVAVLVLIVTYASLTTQTKNSSGIKPVTDIFVGTIKSVDGDTITVDMDIQMSPRQGNDISKTTTLKNVVVTGTTKFFVIEKNKDFVRPEFSSSTTPPIIATSTSQPFFIDTQSTSDQFVANSKVLVKAKENVWVKNNLTALEIKLLPSASVPTQTN